MFISDHLLTCYCRHFCETTLLWLSDVFLENKLTTPSKPKRHLLKSSPRPSVEPVSPTSSPASKRRKAPAKDPSPPQAVAQPKPKQEPATVSAEDDSSGSSSLYRLANPIPEWTTEQVEEWIEECGLQLYSSSFKENSITGADLLELQEEDFVQLGMTKGHQIKLKAALNKLQQFQNLLKS